MSEGEERLVFIFIRGIYSFSHQHAEQEGGRGAKIGENRKEETKAKEKKKVIGGDVIMVRRQQKGLDVVIRRLQTFKCGFNQSRGKWEELPSVRVFPSCFAVHSLIQIWQKGNNVAKFD